MIAAMAWMAASADRLLAALLLILLEEGPELIEDSLAGVRRKRAQHRRRQAEPAVPEIVRSFLSFAEGLNDDEIAARWQEVLKERRQRKG